MFYALVCDSTLTQSWIAYSSIYCYVSGIPTKQEDGTYRSRKTKAYELRTNRKVRQMSRQV
jgi:hypothetical protein